MTVTDFRFIAVDPMTKHSTRTFTENDFNRYLRRQWREKNFRLRKGKCVGICVSELVKHSKQRNAKVETPHLDLWIAILDEFISWQISLASIFYGGRKGDNFTHFDRSITVILMKIVADSIAFRHLILLGYDVAAKIILRSIGEYAELYVAMLDDPTLADEFVKSDVPEGAKAFWKLHVSRGSLQKKMTKAWESWFKGKQPKAAAWFANWGRQSNGKLSAMIHPSFAAGMLSAIPFKTKHAPNENWLGIWGDKSDGSVDTIYMYASFMFPIFLLHDNFPFDDFNAYLCSPIAFDESNELHRHIKNGRSILASLVLSLGKQSNRKYIFPKYDTSIFKRKGRAPRQKHKA
jgi:hypothetical protein